MRPKPQDDDDATLLKTTSFHTTSKFIYTDCKKSLPLPVSCNLQISFFLFFFRKKKKEKKKDWMNHCMLKWYLCIGTWHLYMPVPFFLVHKFIADHRHSYGQWWASSLPKGPFSWPTMRQESDQTFLGLWRRGKKMRAKITKIYILKGNIFNITSLNMGSFFNIQSLPFICPAFRLVSFFMPIFPGCPSLQSFQETFL